MIYTSKGTLLVLIKISINTVIFSILMVLISITQVNAEVYKWTDKNGKIHFSDKPNNKNAKKINVETKLSEAYLKESKLRAQQLKSFQKRMEQSRKEDQLSKEVKSSKIEREKSELKKLCAEIQKDIRLLGKGRPTYYKNNKGKQVFLSDKEKNTTIEKGEIFIRNNCNFN